MAATARRTSLPRSISHALPALLALSVALWTHAGMAADDTSSGSNTPAPQLETIEVIGSHIRRVDIETQHPVYTLDRADIQRTGLSNIADVIQQIVFNGQTLNRNINNGGNGEALANLRSLGFNRTLVLLNGQRFVTDIDGAVDLSAIPLTMVDRVEVLLDSASAIYGSDAIAGVINIVTRKDYDGGEFAGYFGQTDHDDGESRLFDLSYGHKGDGWSAAAGVEYGDNDPIFAGSRAISAVPRYGLPPGATGSPFTPYTNLWLLSRAEAGLGPLRLIEGMPGTSPDDFRPFDRAADKYNYTPLNYLQTPQDRRAVFAQGRYEFSSTLAFVADALVNQRRSAQQLAPPAVSFSADDAGQPDGFGISANNVYNPFGEEIVQVARRFMESGPRVFDQTADTSRLHLGLDGAFTLADRNFTWAADAIGTQVRQREYTTAYADNSKLALAVGPSYFDANGVARCGTPDAPISDCVPINFFGPPGSITPAMLDYVNANEVNRETNASYVFDAHASTNELFTLPAGGLAFAAGVQYRRESGSQLEDPLRASGNENGNGTSSESTSGAYSVTEAYVEFDAPLLAERPFAKNLDFIVGTRYSNYTNFGGTTNSQFGLRWKPDDDLLVRANYAEGFRAPAITEVFQGTARGPDFANDPCDQVNNAPTAAVLARCAQLGVPPNVDSSLQTLTSVQSGNPNLQPETSRGSGVGAVYAPQSLPGLDLSLDWYRIQVRNAITGPNSQSVVDDCYVYNRDAACAYIQRDPADGNLRQVTALWENLPGGIETEGYDFTLNWKHDTPAGLIGINWVTNYVDYFGEIGQPRPGSTLPDGSIAVGNVAGLSSPTTSGLFGVIWHWRSQMALTWQRDVWSASITGRYFGKIAEGCDNVLTVAHVVHDPSLRNLCTGPDETVLIAGVPSSVNRVPSVTFTDLEGTWASPWGAHVTLGVRNAFDRTPPVSYSAFANSFFPDYDLPGRFWYARYRQSF